MGFFPFQGKTHMVEPGIEPGTSWLVDRSSDHQATRLVQVEKVDTAETSVSLYQNALCHTPQDINLDCDRRKKLKSNCILLLKRSVWGAETLVPFLKHVSHLHIKFWFNIFYVLRTTNKVKKNKLHIDEV